MIDFLQTVLAFIITIGILVTVHEFGHYWVARKLGIKILCFSVGFGKPLWQRRFGKDQTEFQLAAIPLGGYVRMLDEREGDVAAEDLPRAFNRQSLGVRAAVVFAGPAFNFLFAIAAYAMLYLIGISGAKAIVGEIEPGSPAQRAGMQAGYEIIEVNGQPASRWEAVAMASLQARLDDESLRYRVIANKLGEQKELEISLAEFSLDDFISGNFFDKIGFKRYTPTLPAELGEVVPNGPAQRAGFLAGDKIIRVNGKTVETWEELRDSFVAAPGKPALMEVRRELQTVRLTLLPEERDGKGYAGIRPAWPPELIVTERYGWWDALVVGTVKTWDMSVLTLRMLGKMLTLEVSFESISGPVGTAQYAGMSFNIGWIAFFSFLAIVSLNLGIINLLPIPVLDGGHLLLYLMEWINGKPLSETLQIAMQKLGLTLLLLLMGLAIFNDLNRILN